MGIRKFQEWDGAHKHTNHSLTFLCGSLDLFINLAKLRWFYKFDHFHAVLKEWHQYTV